MRVVEEGTVRSVTGKMAEIVMAKGETSACASCGLCAKDKNARVVALDSTGFPGISAGNRVRIEIDAPSAYLAGWLLFAQPLALLIAGILAGLRLGEAVLGAELRGLAGVALAVILVALNYVMVSWLDRRFFSVRRARAKILEIIA